MHRLKTLHQRLPRRLALLLICFLVIALWGPFFVRVQAQEGEKLPVAFTEKPLRMKLLILPPEGEISMDRADTSPSLAIGLPGKAQGKGAVDIIDYNDETWQSTQEQEVTDSTGQPNDEFGEAVAFLDANHILASSPGKNGDAGALFLLQRPAGGTWTLQPLALPPGVHPGYLFGWSVAPIPGAASTQFVVTTPGAAHDAGGGFLGTFDHAFSVSYQPLTFDPAPAPDDFTGGQVKAFIDPGNLPVNNFFILATGTQLHRRSKLFANYGTVYDQLPLDINDRQLAGEGLLIKALTGHPPGPICAITTQGQTECGMIDKNKHIVFQDRISSPDNVDTFGLDLSLCTDNHGTDNLAVLGSEKSDYTATLGGPLVAETASFFMRPFTPEGSQKMNYQGSVVIGEKFPSLLKDRFQAGLWWMSNCTSALALAEDPPTKTVKVYKVWGIVGAIKGKLVAKFTAKFVQADFSTYYEVTPTNPKDNTLRYDWSNSNGCGDWKWDKTSPKAQWYHPDTPGACPPQDVHPGTITVVVTDDHKTITTVVYRNGSDKGEIDNP